ncbi:MAG: hypothetical protein HY398_01385 [Candidatus Doudnabacteria bacterium]|nr:hypothetical protein [Candidatus Doudnabacteria bacterium]
MSDGILDAFIGSQQTAALQNFNPQSLVLSELNRLSPREREVLVARHGLSDGVPQTLERIGREMSLTRERIRQIEKDAMRKLSALPYSAELDRGLELIFQIIEEHGNILREDRLLEILAPQPSAVSQQAILFMLALGNRFVARKETPAEQASWSLNSFDPELGAQILASAIATLERAGKPLPPEELEAEDHSGLPLPALESMLGVSKKVHKNPFGLWGLSRWAEITPKDVGDKAYLILKHHGQPEHYARITELINKQKFDSRTAHKETVHNELIRDDRFVLVGRGIYGLAEWGYKKGVVAEIIREILQQAARPLSKAEIIEAVSKQRLVKKNTIIVGLSNKKNFRKTEDSKYVNV